jgi:hypothetical protein
VSGRVGNRGILLKTTERRGASTSGAALGVFPCVIPYSLTSPRLYKILVMKALLGSGSWSPKGPQSSKPCLR